MFHETTRTSVAAVLVLTAALLACKSDDQATSTQPVAATPEARVTPAAQPIAQPAQPPAVGVAQPAQPPAVAAAPAPAAPALEEAVIAAGKNRTGGSRRGIVKMAANFKAKEITRLNNGTAVGILERIHGGWLKIKYPYPSGTSVGFIHQDVVSMKGMPSQAERRR